MTWKFGENCDDCFAPFERIYLTERGEQLLCVDCKAEANGLERETEPAAAELAAAEQGGT